MRQQNRARIGQNIRRRLETVTGLDETNPTGILNSLIQGISDVTEQLWQDGYTEFSQQVLSTAVGIRLDEIGKSFGVNRKTQLPASSKTSQILYVKQGTFGDYSNGQPILVPNGSMISSIDGRYVVRVFSESARNTGGILLDPLVSEQPIPVISLAEDSLEVIPANTLTLFNGPLQAIKTRNISVIRGQAQESDENYRYRIEVRRKADNADNTSQLLFSVLSVPGVSNARLIPFSRGGGSMDILIIGSNGTPDNEILNSVRNIAYKNSASTFYTVRGIKTALLSLTVIGSQSDRQLVNREFIGYIDTLVPGQSFLFDDFQRRVSGRITYGNITYNKVKTTDRVITVPQETVFIADSSNGDPVQIITP